MTCRQLNDSLVAYRSGGLRPEERGAFAAHLASCGRCIEYVKSYELTIRLARHVHRRRDDTVPPHIPQELVTAILAARLETADRLA